jgi:hypothetical protein
MAKNYYEGDLNLDLDWGGNGEQLPLSGQQVQSILKNSLNSKVGFVGYCETTGMYVMTKDEATFLRYDELIRADKTSEEAKKLMISEFKAPYEYSANIEISNPANGYKVILYGETGVELTFRAETKDSNGELFSESYTYKITSRNGGTSQTLPGFINKDAGYVTVNIDNIIAKGSNSITISVTGRDSNVSTFKSVEIKVIMLSISDNFNISNAYNVSNSNQTLSLNYKLETNGLSKVKFFIDYEKVGEKTHTTSTDSGVFTYDIRRGVYTSGVHSLMYYVEFDDGSSSEPFRTPIYYRNFFIDNGDAFNLPLIGMSYTIPYDETFISENKQPNIFDAEQYETLVIPFAVYNNKNETEVVVMVAEGGSEVFENQANIVTNNGIIVNHSITVNKQGLMQVKFVSENTEVVVGPFEVTESSMQMEPVTDDLIFSLLAKGKSNDFIDFDQWVSNIDGEEYKAKFNNFKWTADSGWNNDRLSIARGTSVEIPFRPFADTTKLANGMTFEFEFSTKNVYDDNAQICRIIDSVNGYPGIEITATEAKFIVDNNTVVSTKFKSGENNRICFVITPKMAGDPTWRNRFVKIYVNGVICGVVVYNESHSFYNQAIVKFEGTNKAEIELYAITAYKRALDNDEILNNYMFYRPNNEEKISLYNRNNIYIDNSDGNDIDIDKIKQQIPVMVFYQRSESEGKIEDLETEYTDKKKTVYFDIEYTDINNPIYNFTVEYARVTPQGTSSMKYPKKNFRFYTNKEDNTVLYDYEGNVVENRKYSFKENAPAVDCWCLKADFAESSGTHNTGTARYWETVLREAKIYTKSQIRANAAKYKTDVRTTVDGFPIVLFYKSLNDDKPRFVGKYNFNNDKSTEDVFGFTGGPKVEDKEVKYVQIGKTRPQINKDKYKIGAYTTTPTEKSDLFSIDSNGMYYMLQTKKMFDNPKMECWEILDSGSLVALFTTTEGWGMDSKNEKIGRYKEDGGFEEAFESRFPDCGNYFHTNELRRLCDWLISCRYLKIDNKTSMASPMTDEELYEMSGSETLTIQSLTEHQGFDAYTVGDTEYNFWELQTFPNTAENRKLKFRIEKYDHFDMEKMAAYYIYLMRFGGVDQTVKNAMLTTEGPADENRPDLPSLWFFINYDNDTILGVKNTGHLKHDPYITRTTFEPGTTTPTYAGRESTLWNNLEADDEFMNIVAETDRTLYASVNGLSYQNAIDMYNNKQAGRWCERIYNMDAQTKYIDTYISPSKESENAGDDATLDYLFNVQGPRSAHRKWWLSKRFNIYDSIFSTGDYLKQIFKIIIDKLDDDKNVYIKSGEDIYYGYGLNTGESYKTPTTVKPGETCTLTISKTINYGSPISIYAAVNIEEIDLREVGNNLTIIEAAGAYTQALGTKLKILNVGDRNHPFFNNTTLNTISGHGVLEKLEELDVTGISNMGSLENLYKLKNLKKLYSAGTNMTSISFTEGGNIEEIEASASLTSLKFVETLNITWDDIRLFDLEYAEDGETVLKKVNNTYGSLNTLSLTEVPQLLNDHQPILEWLNLRKDSGISVRTYALELNGIEWTIPADEISKLWVLGEVGTENNSRSIRGKIRIDKQLSDEEVDRFIGIFGSNCFNEGATVQIIANPNIYINGIDNITEGDGWETYEIIKVGLGNGEISPSLNEHIVGSIGETTYGSGVYFEFDSTNNIIRIKVDELKRNVEYLRIRLTFYPDSGGSYGASKDIFITKRDYPIRAEISGRESLQSAGALAQYNLTLFDDDNNTAFNGNFDVTWSLRGNAAEEEWVVITETNKMNCTVKVNYLFNSDFEIVAKVTRDIEDETGIEICTGIKNVSIKDNSVLIVPNDNPALFWLLYDNGFINDVNKMTFEQAYAMELSTEGNNGKVFGDLFNGVTEVIHGGVKYDFKSFDEFSHFTRIYDIPNKMFKGCTKLQKISLPEQISTIGIDAFNGCSVLKNVRIPSDVTYIGTNAFYGCNAFTNMIIPDKVSEIGNGAFNGCSSLESITYGESITSLPVEINKDCIKLNNVIFKGDVVSIGASAFNNCAVLETLNIPSTLQTLDFKETNPFSLCYKLTCTGGNEIFVTENGCLYYNEPETGFKWLIRQNPTREIISGETIYVANHALNGMTIEDVVIWGNLNINGADILYGSEGNSVTLINTIPNNVNCSGLFKKTKYHQYIFANGETIIPDNCFNECETLTNITLPETIKEIRNDAFRKCKGLTSIVIPSSVTKMGSNVFAENLISETVGLKTINMLPNVPPQLPDNGELFVSMLDVKFIVNGDAYDAYMNDAKWGRYNKFIKLGTLPSKGYFRIVNDAQVHYSSEIESTVSDVTIGGISPIQHYSGYYEFTNDGVNNSLSIMLNGVKIGEFTHNYCTIYRGDNSSLYSGNGIDFSKGIMTMDTLPSDFIVENTGKWYIDTAIGGFRSPNIKDPSTQHEVKLNLNKYADAEGNIKVTWGQISEADYDNATMYDKNGNVMFTAAKKNTYRTESIFAKTSEPYTLKWSKDISQSYYLDCFWIESIGSPVYIEPILPSDKIVEVVINVTTGLGNNEVLNGKTIEITNGKYFSQKYTLKEDGSIIISLPKNEEFNVVLTDFVIGTKGYYAPDITKFVTDENVELNLTYFTYFGVYCVDVDGNFDETFNDSKNYVGVFYADDENDFAILKDTLDNKAWLNLIMPDNGKITYTSEDELLIANIDGLVNSREISTRYSGTLSVVNTITNIKTLSNIFDWYLPSYYEMNALLNNNSIKNALINIGSSNDDGKILWTSNTPDNNNAWAISTTEGATSLSRTQPNTIRIFGRKRI